MLLVNLRKETLNTIHVEDMDGKVIHTFHHVDGKDHHAQIIKIKFRAMYFRINTYLPWFIILYASCKTDLMHCVHCVDHINER